jgi:hypothetical protein
MIVESYEDVILLSGALRSNFWETIHTAISLTLKRHPTGVIIDCSGITECTPAGAETFRDAIEFIERHDARVIVAAVPQPVLEVLKTVAEVRSQLAVAESVEAARRSLDLLVEPESKKSKPPRERLEKVVLYVCEKGPCFEGYDLAEQTADSLHAEIVLAYVIVVPRDLPIQAPLPQQEESAALALETARAELAKRQVPCSAVLERGRDIGSALQQVMEQEESIRLLVPLRSDDDATESDLKLVKTLFGKITQPIVLLRPAAKVRAGAGT